MSRSLFLTHVLPAAASSAIAGAVNYGIFEHSFRGAGIGALAGLVYSATHDVLKSKITENSFISHSVAILTSAILSYGISAAAAAAGLIAMPTLASLGALVAAAILVNSVTRLLLKPRKPESNSPDPQPQPPPQQSVKQTEQVDPEPLQEQRVVPHVANPAPVQPKATPAPLPPAIRPQPAAVKPPTPEAVPPEKSKISAENPPPPPSQRPPAPAQDIPKINLPTVAEFLASSDFKSCTDWLADFKNIEAKKSIHKNKDRYVITAQNFAFIPGAQYAASWMNSHTPEQLAKDLQDSAAIFGRTLPMMITLHNKDKNAIRLEIEKLKPSIKEALKKLAVLKKTYQNTSNVHDAIGKLTDILGQNQRDLLTKIGQ